MWFERFVIIVISLHHDYLPSAWHIYKPTLVDYGILLGSFGIFFTLVLLFARVLPVIATTEMKADLPGAQPRQGAVHELRPSPSWASSTAPTRCWRRCPSSRAKRAGAAGGLHPVPGARPGPTPWALRRSPLAGMVMVMGVLGALTALLVPDVGEPPWTTRWSPAARRPPPGRPSCPSCSRSRSCSPPSPPGWACSCC